MKDDHPHHYYCHHHHHYHEDRGPHVGRRQRRHERRRPRHRQSWHPQVRERSPTRGCTFRLTGRRGCETWIVREGYEGLVRGNSEAEDAGQTSQASELNVQVPTARAYDPTFTQNLRFGDGRLLRDGTADFISEGRSLQGRYIVRVGWDDVRGWFGVVSLRRLSTNMR